MNRIVIGGLLAALMALVAPAPARAAVGMGTIEESPTAARERWREKAEADYKEGMKARAAGDQKNAVRFLLRVAKMGRMRMDSEYPQLAFNELKVIGEEARKEMAVARDLISGEDPAAGVMELQRIMRTYLGLGQAKEAGALLRQLEGDPKFQAALRAAQLQEELDKAADLEEEAEAVLKPADPDPPLPADADPPAAPKTKLPTTPPPPPNPEGVKVAAVKTKELSEKERRAARVAKLAEAYDIYCRIAKQGTGTEPGKKADEARQRLEKDVDLLARIKQAQLEGQAKAWLSLANNYYRAGRFESAREYCKKILAECPETPQAVDAKVLLKGIK